MQPNPGLPRLSAELNVRVDKIKRGKCGESKYLPKAKLKECNIETW